MPDALATLSKHLFLLLALTSTLRADPLNVYVSPAGHDEWTGTLPSASSDHHDGPLGTLEAARDAARALRASHPDQSVNVVLRGGTYFLSRPLEITSADGGSQAAPASWCAFGNETAVISGGQKISDWKTEQFNGREVWVAHLNANQRLPQELWINNRRCPRARFPKTGYLTVTGLREADQKLDQYQGVDAIPFQHGSFPAWPGATNGDVVLFTKWTESHLSVASIDEQSNVLRFTKPTVFKPEEGDPYFFENIPECLTEPGEWLLTRDRMLRYIPFPGEKRGEVEAIVPSLSRLLLVHGGSNGAKKVEYLSLKQLTFAHAEWYFDATYRASGAEKESGFGQAEIGVPAALTFDHASNCQIRDCVVQHVGTYAIDLAAGCTHVQIEHSQFLDLGAGGIKIGQTHLSEDPAGATSDNTVSDCTIADGGKLFPSAIGIWIGQSPNNLLVHNDIHGLTYSAISIGWTWGYGPANAGGNRVEDNLIHHIGTPADGVPPVFSDMGGIYTLGAQPNTVIRHNQFHDIAARVYGGWGIYFDEGSTGILAENNLVYRTSDAGFHQHYGQSNTVQNNIFALGKKAQIQRTRLEDHVSFTFHHNILCWAQGDLLAGDWTRPEVDFDDNLYWPLGSGSAQFTGRSLAQWQAEGQDVHSVAGPNQFTDPEHGDFHLRPNAVLNGFKPFDLTAFGPR